ncbi:MAG: hypothetical protein IPF99_17785 [Deltaproteobacteria bacterium]|nr:hypothetical protein [Deltaproteobacteria bacterium]
MSCSGREKDSGVRCTRVKISLPASELPTARPGPRDSSRSDRSTTSTRSGAPKRSREMLPTASSIQRGESVPTTQPRS